MRARSLTIQVGATQPLAVPLLRREWRLWAGERPLKVDLKTPAIKPAIDYRGEAMFPELVAAMELGDLGASWWCWIDHFNHTSYRQGMFDRPPVKPPEAALEVLGQVGAENGGSLNGVWDAFAIFDDGRVIFREVKRRGRDRLNSAQHHFADASRRALPTVELAVVEWMAS